MMREQRRKHELYLVARGCLLNTEKHWARRATAPYELLDQLFVVRDTIVYCIHYSAGGQGKGEWLLRRTHEQETRTR